MARNSWSSQSILSDGSVTVEVPVGSSPSRPLGLDAQSTSVPVPTDRERRHQDSEYEKGGSHAPFADPSLPREIKTNGRTSTAASFQESEARGKSHPEEGEGHEQEKENEKEKETVPPVRDSDFVLVSKQSFASSPPVSRTSRNVVVGHLPPLSQEEKESPSSLSLRQPSSRIDTFQSYRPMETTPNSKHPIVANTDPPPSAVPGPHVTPLQQEEGQRKKTQRTRGETQGISRPNDPAYSGVSTVPSKEEERMSTPNDLRHKEEEEVPPRNKEIAHPPTEHSFDRQSLLSPPSAGLPSMGALRRETGSSSRLPLAPFVPTEKESIVNGWSTREKHSDLPPYQPYPDGSRVSSVGGSQTDYRVRAALSSRPFQMERKTRVEAGWVQEANLRETNHGEKTHGTRKQAVSSRNERPRPGSVSQIEVSDVPVPVPAPRSPPPAVGLPPSGGDPPPPPTQVSVRSGSYRPSYRASYRASHRSDPARPSQRRQMPDRVPGTSLSQREGEDPNLLVEEVRLLRQELHDLKRSKASATLSRGTREEGWERQREGSNPHRDPNSRFSYVSPEGEGGGGEEEEIHGEVAESGGDDFLADTQLYDMCGIDIEEMIDLGKKVTQREDLDENHFRYYVHQAPGGYHPGGEMGEMHAESMSSIVRQQIMQLRDDLTMLPPEQLREKDIRKLMKNCDEIMRKEITELDIHSLRNLHEHLKGTVHRIRLSVARTVIVNDKIRYVQITRKVLEMAAQIKVLRDKFMVEDLAFFMKGMESNIRMQMFLNIKTLNPEPHEASKITFTSHILIYVVGALMSSFFPPLRNFIMKIINDQDGNTNFWEHMRQEAWNLGKRSLKDILTGATGGKKKGSSTQHKKKKKKKKNSSSSRQRKSESESESEDEDEDEDESTGEHGSESESENGDGSRDRRGKKNKRRRSSQPSSSRHRPSPSGEKESGTDTDTDTDSSTSTRASARASSEKGSGRDSDSDSEQDSDENEEDEEGGFMGTAMDMISNVTGVEGNTLKTWKRGAQNLFEMFTGDQKHKGKHREKRHRHTERRDVQEGESESRGKKKILLCNITQARREVRSDL